MKRIFNNRWWGKHGVSSGLTLTILLLSAFLILVDCSTKVQKVELDIEKNQHDFILTSFLFPDTIFLYLNSSKDISAELANGHLIEAVGEEIDTLGFSIQNHLTGSPCSYLLIHDCSGSMRPYIDMVLCVMEHFIMNSNPLDEFRIIQLGGKLKAMKNFTNDKNNVIQWLRTSNPPIPNGTPLFDALQLGIDYLGSKQREKILIVFTDGNVASTENYEYLIEWAKDVNVRIFVVGMGSIKPGLLSELAKNTDGIFLADDDRTCSQTAYNLSCWISNFYRISYSPAGKKLDGQTHMVTFSVPNSSINFHGQYRVPKDETIFARARIVHEIDTLSTGYNLPEELSVPVLIPFYDMGNSALYPSAKQKLDNMLQNLLTIPEKYTVTLYIDGYTCDVGSEITNLLLSAERAETVNDYVGSKLTPNITTELNFYGESNPLNENKTASEKALNRRVTIRVFLHQGQNASLNDSSVR
ncbi:OmpA family protein [bacterium]|nr:OmpA family protein [bacterium]